LLAKLYTRSRIGQCLTQRFQTQTFFRTRSIPNIAEREEIRPVYSEAADRLLELI
jgi:hypothetical protein